MPDSSPQRFLSSPFPSYSENRLPRSFAILPGRPAPIDRADATGIMYPEARAGQERAARGPPDPAWPVPSTTPTCSDIEGNIMSTTERDRTLLERAVDLAREARESGNHPFGALLADAEGAVLLEVHNSSGSTRDCTGHAETNLARLASTSFPREKLASCTLYSSAEPCAMCAGAIYWAGIGRVVYALSESELLGITGDSPENPTLSLPCREVFARGQKKIEVEGPVDGVAGARKVHEGFWRS